MPLVHDLFRDLSLRFQSVHTPDQPVKLLFMSSYCNKYHILLPSDLKRYFQDLLPFYIPASALPTAQ